MSKSSHELALLTQIEALADNLQAQDFATRKGFTETYYFNQEDLNGNATLYIEAHPNLRGKILAISATNITTEFTAGGTLIAGDSGDTNGYQEVMTFPAIVNDNANDATNYDGVGNIFPFSASVPGAELIITASDLVQLLFTDVSTDTGIFDLAVTIRWFE